MLTILPDPLPEVSVDDLQARADELHERERETRLALGEAMLRGLPGEAARVELRRIREDLDGLYAAARIIEAIRGRGRR